MAFSGLDDELAAFVEQVAAAVAQSAPARHTRALQWRWCLRHNSYDTDDGQAALAGAAPIPKCWLCWLLQLLASLYICIGACCSGEDAAPFQCASSIEHFSRGGGSGSGSHRGAVGFLEGTRHHDDCAARSACC